MRNIRDKEDLVKVFIENVDLNLETVKRYGDLPSLMKGNNVDLSKEIINKISMTVKQSLPEELNGIEDVTVYISMSGSETEIRVIDMVVRNKYKHKGNEFKFKKQIIASDRVFEEVADFLKCSYVELITDYLITENLEVLNSKLDEITAKAGNNFKVRVTSPLGNSGKKIAKITDSEVVFVADEERALELEDVLVLCEPTEVLTEDMINKGVEDEVVIFAQAQTTPQFVGVHDPLICYVCEISRLVKAFTLIKKVNSKNVEKLRGNKETLAYYHKEDTYAVLSVNEDGKEVVLQPFNVNTLEVVNEDILG